MVDIVICYIYFLHCRSFGLKFRGVESFQITWKCKMYIFRHYMAMFIEIAYAIQDVGISCFHPSYRVYILSIL